MHLVDFQYAKALLQSLSEPTKIRTLYGEVKNILIPILEISEVQDLLKNPIINSTAKVSILKSTCEGKVDELLFPFFSLVFKKKRDIFLKKILKSFLSQSEIRLDMKKVFITTAYDLSIELMERFKEIGSKLTGCKNIVLETIIEPNIIGGFIMRFDSMQLDCSLKEELIRLKKQLSLNSL